jgi:hypothetical protein
MKQKGQQDKKREQVGRYRGEEMVKSIQAKRGRNQDGEGMV